MTHVVPEHVDAMVGSPRSRRHEDHVRKHRRAGGVSIPFAPIALAQTYPSRQIVSSSHSRPEALPIYSLAYWRKR